MGRGLVFGIIGGVLGAIGVLLVQGQPFHLVPVGMSYADLAATLLGASGVLIAIIGVFIAGLAVWGFTAFRSITKNSARAHVDQQLRDGALRSHVELVVTNFLTKEFDGGTLRRLFEDRLDEILVTAPAERAREDDASDSDVAVDDL